MHNINSSETFGNLIELSSSANPLDDLLFGPKGVRRMSYDEALDDLLKISDGPSICCFQHNLIWRPRTFFEYALSFVASLLRCARPINCYLMIRGIGLESTFLENPENVGYDDAWILYTVDKTEDDMWSWTPLWAWMDEDICSSATISEAIDQVDGGPPPAGEERRDWYARTIGMTWREVLEHANPPRLCRLLELYDIPLQIVAVHDGFLAAVRCPEATFGMRGKTPEEALVKTLLLAQLAVPMPIFDSVSLL